ncbi:hypothetical protein OAK75_09555 [Bacteriovoracales bacterium]|nr:hypothetical protein [Bacteriovoracales bacterium]
MEKLLLKTLGLFLLFIPLANSLEVDETLTFRILKLSKSKKTLLLNRGSDDGLEVDDHAKFYLTSTGVVARAVVKKVSPTRTVWSLYRLVNEAEIDNGRALQLKIVSAVKLTADSTRMFKVAPIPIDGGGVLTGVKDSTTKEEREDLASLKGDEDFSERNSFKHMDSRQNSRGDGRGTLAKTSWDFFGTFGFNSLAIYQDGATTKTISKSEMSLSLGVEKYFPHQNINFFRRTSLFGEFDWAKTISKEVSGGDDEGDEDKKGFSAGVNYHLFADPFSFDSFIPFVGLGIGLGTDERVYVNSTETSYSENYSHYFLGAGIKFYSRTGFGLKGVVDYYLKSQNQTDLSSSTVTTLRTVGIRTRLGITFRF